MSFDVFDTLILRALARPIDAFAIVKLRLMTSDTALMHPYAVDAFPDLRVRAERAARDAKQRAGETHREVTFDEIYDVFAELSGADADAIEAFKDAELAVERDIVYPNPAAKEIFEAARSQGKTIVLCSDMYLPAVEIMSLLRRCGYEGYDALYVSCAHGCSKHAGTMYALVATRHGAAPARILHVGDNEYGDMRMAREAGWATLHLPRPPQAERVSVPWRDEPSFFLDAVASIVEGLCRQRAVNRDGAARDPWEELGFRVFGPLFTGFLLWLAAAVRERRPDKVLFLARDAYFVQQHLGAFLGVLPGEIRTEYAYVSRGSLLVPSLADFPLARLNHLFSGRYGTTVARHLRRLGLQPERFINVVRSAGFEGLDERVKNGDSRMRDLLGKLYQELMQVSAERRGLAQRYVAQVIGDARSVMLVDVGWVGNIQASLVRMLGPRHADVVLHGYYVGVFNWATENIYPGHPMKGWLTRRGDAHEVEQILWWGGGVEILEFAMTAPHGTTLGYRETSDGTVVPIVESGDVEGDLGRLAQRLQQGAAAFVDAFLSTYGSIPPESLCTRAWGAEFFRLVTDPTRDEVDLLGDVTHGDVAGDSTIRLPLAPDAATLDESADSGLRCYWKTGFIVRNGLQEDDTFSSALYLSLYPDVDAAITAGSLRSAREHWIKNGQREGRIGTWAGWLRTVRKSTEVR